MSAVKDPAIERLNPGTDLGHELRTWIASIISEHESYFHYQALKGKGKILNDKYAEMGNETYHCNEAGNEAQRCNDVENETQKATRQNERESKQGAGFAESAK